MLVNESGYVVVVPTLGARSYEKPRIPIFYRINREANTGEQIKNRVLGFPSKGPPFLVSKRRRPDQVTVVVTYLLVSHRPRLYVLESSVLNRSFGREYSDNSVFSRTFSELGRETKGSLSLTTGPSTSLTGFWWVDPFRPLLSLRFFDTHLRGWEWSSARRYSHNFFCVSRVWRSRVTLGVSVGSSVFVYGGDRGKVLILFVSGSKTDHQTWYTTSPRDPVVPLLTFTA